MSECGRQARHEIGLPVTAAGEHRIWSGTGHEAGWLI
jgi:hypothetical protein